MNFFQKIIAVWQNVSLVQKALLLAIVMTAVLAAGLGTKWVTKPDMGLLYSNLDPEEAGKIIDKLGEKNIPYDLNANGTSVYVPKKQISQARLDLAKDGLPGSSRSGYGIFDNEKIGISPFVQGVNLKRALQDELAMSIQLIDGISHARVHLVSPKQSMFAVRKQNSSASIILKLRGGYRMSGLNIAAITHLVAGSVEGLKSENVTVVDSQGRLLSSESGNIIASGAGTVQDYKERVELYLSNQVQDMLATVLGPGRSTVKVSAVIDMTTSNTVTKTPDKKGVKKKEEIQDKKEPLPPRPSAEEGGDPISGGTKTDKTILTEYEVGSTIETKTVLPGVITSLKVAVVVDLSPIEAPAKEGEEADTSSAEPIMTVTDVEELIANALGDTTTATDIKVVEAKFQNPIGPLLEEGGINWSLYMAITKQSSLGIMAVCALIVLKIFSGAGKKALATAALPAELAGGEVQPTGLLPAGNEAAQAMMLRQQLASTLQSNPNQAKQLFSSWLEEKGS